MISSVHMITACAMHIYQDVMVWKLNKSHCVIFTKSNETYVILIILFIKYINVRRHIS